MKVIDWDQYFMSLAIIASKRSKDPNTQVGAIIVNSNNIQVSMGYNGMVSGIDESKLSWKNDKNLPFHEQKYAYVVHAEANAILHMPSVKDIYRIYVTLFPCNECTKLLLTKGIKEIIYLEDKYKGSPTDKAAKKMLDLTYSKYRHLTIDREIKL